MKTENNRLSQKNLRQFGLIVGSILLAIGFFLFWRNETSFKPFILLGMVVFSLGLLFPILLKPIHYIMLKISERLGRFMTIIILTLLYYLLITPISLAYRLFGKQFLELKWNKSQKGYWHFRKKIEISKHDNERQY